MLELRVGSLESLSLRDSNDTSRWFGTWLLLLFVQTSIYSDCAEYMGFIGRSELLLGGTGITPALGWVYTPCDPCSPANAYGIHKSHKYLSAVISLPNLTNKNKQSHLQLGLHSRIIPKPSSSSPVLPRGSPVKYSAALLLPCACDTTL